MTIQDDYIASLERENDQLRERIALLEKQFGLRIYVPLEFNLTNQESALFGLLLKRDIVTKDMAMSMLYGGKAVEPEMKIIDVFICKMRVKLKKFGVVIETHWGAGYSLKSETKAAVQKLLDRSTALAG